MISQYLAQFGNELSEKNGNNILISESMESALDAIIEAAERITLQRSVIG